MSSSSSPPSVFFPLTSTPSSSSLLHSVSSSLVSSFVSEILPLFLHSGCLSLCYSPPERFWTLSHLELAIEYVEKFCRKFPSPLDQMSIEDFTALLTLHQYSHLIQVEQPGFYTLSESNLRAFIQNKPSDVEISFVLPSPLSSSDFPPSLASVPFVTQRIPREISEIAERTKKRYKAHILSNQQFSSLGHRLICLFHLNTGDCRNSRCGQIHLQRTQNNQSQGQAYCSHYQRSFDPSTTISCSYHMRPLDCPNGKHVQLSVDSFGIFHFDENAKPNKGQQNNQFHSIKDQIQLNGGAISHSHEYCKLSHSHVSVCLFYLVTGDCRNKNARNRPETHVHLNRSEALITQVKGICPYWNENAAEQKQGRWCKFDKEQCDRRHELVSVGSDGAVFITKPINMNQPGWTPSRENPQEAELYPIQVLPPNSAHLPGHGGGGRYRG